MGTTTWGARRSILLRATALLVVVQVTTGASWGIVGDSVAHLAREEVEARGADIRAAPGVDIRAGRPGLRQLVRAGHQRIVVALGYMDAPLATRAELIRRIRPVLHEDVHGVRCVLWVDLATTGERAGWAEATGRFNALIRRLTAESGDAVAPWSVFSQEHRNWFRRDGFHLSLRGQAAYARFVAGQVNQRC